MESKKRRWPLIILIIFIIVIAALYVYLYLVPQLTGSIAETYIVDKGVITQVSPVNAIVVREEEAVKAPVSGNISYYSGETEKTRQGFVVADIYSNGEKHSLSCQKTGIVSYYIDGYENMFSPSSLGAINIEEYIDFDVSPVDEGKSSVTAGDTAYKLITSNTWYFLLIVPKENKPSYPISGNLKICLEDGTIISAVVMRYIGLGDTIGVVAYTKDYYSEFSKLRSIKADVISKETEGYMIPSTAIGEENEKSGIFVLGLDGEYYFREIEILGVDGDNTLISSDGNIKLYDEILRDFKER